VEFIFQIPAYQILRGDPQMKRKSIFITAILLTLHLYNVVLAQPTAFKNEVHSLASVQPVVPEPIDLQTLLMEDYQENSQIGPYRFAIARPVEITHEIYGVWEEIDEETLLWRLPIASPGAFSLNLGFTSFSLPPGSRLYIYSADYSEVLGPFTEDDNKEHGQLWTPLIHSDAIIVELTIPVSQLPQLVLELTSINHGYRRLDATYLLAIGDSNDCQVNVTYPEGEPYRDQIRSVALYTFNGTVACTGTMINNTAQDDRPYFLTAFHCFDKDKNEIINVDEKNAAQTLVVYWNYQASTCEGTNTSDYQTQRSAIFQAGDFSSDFALVELEDMPPYTAGVYYAGWDRSSAAPLSGTAIHHPQQDLKKINIENDQLYQTSVLVPYGDIDVVFKDFFEVRGWDVGMTEEGSSGCPLFDPNKRVVAQLTSASGTCNTQSSWFGPLYMSWTGEGTSDTRLSDWLDPGNTGVTFLEGKNPRNQEYLIEYSSSNVPQVIHDMNTITSTLVIDDNYKIFDLDVKLDITHTFAGDLGVYLIPPPGLLPVNSTPLPPPEPIVPIEPIAPPRGPINASPSKSPNSIKLFSALGVEGENFHSTILDNEAQQSIKQGSVPFTGWYRPEEDLNLLYGKNIAGMWTLEIRDHMRNDVGTLNSWSLILEKDFCSIIISSFPYYEFFEDGFGDWINVASDDVDWGRHRNATDSSNTGPSSALSGDYYIYIESSKLDDIGHIGYPKKTAILESPCIEQLGDKPLGSIDDSLSFGYHMYGAAMGTLIVDVSDDNGNSWTQLWSKSGNQGNSWHEATIDISEYVYKKIKLRFRGITGTNYTSDIAIDSISINQWSRPPVSPYP